MAGLAALALMLGLVVPAVASSNARAATGPATSPTWTDNIGERVSPQDAGLNGTVLYLNPASTYFPNRGVSTAGDTLWTAPRALPGFVLAQPVTDAAGNTYEIEQVDVGEPAGTPGRTDVVARNGSTVLWDVTPDSSYELFRIAVANGRVYAVGVVPNTLNYALFTLDASTGATVARTDAVNGQIDEVFAYNGGVAALVVGGTSDEIRYYSADGQSGPAYPIPSGYGITSFQGESQVAADGTVYLTYINDSSTCVQPSVDIVTPGGGLSGPFTLGGPCVSGYSPLTSTVTPQGLAVIIGGSSITLVRPDGTVTPPSALPATSGQGSSIAAIHGNTDGNVLVAQQASNISCAAAPNLGCAGLQFDLVDPATGNLVAPVALQQPAGNTVDYLMFRPENGIAFDGPRLYATVSIETNINNNFSETADLEAFDGPSMGQEYPESLLNGTGTSPSPTPTPTPTVTSPSPTPTPTVTPPASCPQLQLFSLRGSRADTSDASVTDDVALEFAKQLKVGIPGLKFTPIAYDAIPVGYGSVPAYAGGLYDSSVLSGTDALLSAYLQFRKDCPTTYVGLEGYSQGQQVVRELYTTIGGDPDIAFVAGFGDPLFDHAHQSIDVGTGAHTRLEGIYYQIHSAHSYDGIPTKYLSRWHDWCGLNDPICNYSLSNLTACGLNLSSCPHMQYIADGDVAAAAGWATKVFKRLPKLK
jgi:hypothetical protein